MKNIEAKRRAVEKEDMIKCMCLDVANGPGQKMTDKEKQSRLRDVDFNSEPFATIIDNIKEELGRKKDLLIVDLLQQRDRNKLVDASRAVLKSERDEARKKLGNQKAIYIDAVNDILKRQMDDFLFMRGMIESFIVTRFGNVRAIELAQRGENLGSIFNAYLETTPGFGVINEKEECSTRELVNTLIEQNLVNTLIEQNKADRMRDQAEIERLCIFLYIQIVDNMKAIKRRLRDIDAVDKEEFGIL